VESAVAVEVRLMMSAERASVSFTRCRRRWVACCRGTCLVG
jgi:hypothetical protein